MAARTTPTPPAPVEEYDFDNWSEEDETKAIAELVPDVRYVIVERTFVGRFADGVIVKLPLSISLDDIDALTETTPNPVDQVKTLLRTIGGEASVQDFSRHDLSETIIMADKFFRVFTRISQAALPE
jgi:hypothetical protein